MTNHTCSPTTTKTHAVPCSPPHHTAHTKWPQHLLAPKATAVIYLHTAYMLDKSRGHTRTLGIDPFFIQHYTLDGHLGHPPSPALQRHSKRGVLVTGSSWAVRTYRLDRRCTYKKECLHISNLLFYTNRHDHIWITGPDSHLAFGN